MRPARILLSGALAAACFLGVSHVGPAPSGAAQGTETLRITTLAPRGSQFFRVFQAWDASLRKETGGQLRLQVAPSPAGTRDANLVGRLRGGQLDGATLTVAGLSQLTPAAVVLALPGIYQDMDRLDRVRDALEGDLDDRARKAGFVRLGWLDLGGVRFLSKAKPVRTPQDLRGRRPWSGPDDVVFGEVLRAAGGQGVTLPIGEVGAALRAGRVDVVAASAVGALSMGWHAEATHVSAQPHWPLVGATLLRKGAYDRLDPDHRAALERTGAQAHAAVRRLLRRDDTNALNSMTGRQVESVPWTAAAWQDVHRQARQRLAARYFDTALLKKAEQLAP
jgi:TRAP-type transport system periplasmic protein